MEIAHYRKWRWGREYVWAHYGSFWIWHWSNKVNETPEPLLLSVWESRWTFIRTCVLLQRYKLAPFWFCLNVNSELSAAVAQTNVAPQKKRTSNKRQKPTNSRLRCTQKVQSGVFWKSSTCKEFPKAPFFSVFVWTKDQIAKEKLHLKKKKKYLCTCGQGVRLLVLKNTTDSWIYYLFQLAAEDHEALENNLGRFLKNSCIFKKKTKMQKKKKVSSWLQYDCVDICEI